VSGFDKIEGYLEVGTNDQGEIVIHHPDLKRDERGVGHIVFSKAQARDLANLLLKHAGAVPRLTLRMLLDAGLNGFAFQLVAESLAERSNPEDFGPPFRFNYKGLRFTVEHEPGEEIDGRHQ
jgi:hypothetical protein